MIPGGDGRRDEAVTNLSEVATSYFRDQLFPGIFRHQNLLMRVQSWGCGIGNPESFFSALAAAPLANSPQRPQNREEHFTCIYESRR
jgi:hypothetical protein